MIKEEAPLYEIAHARSGDKGIHANIGVIAYTPDGYAFLKEYLTKEAVHDYFKPLGARETIRYELPNIGAFNFILKGILGKGASRSLRIDAQGKALGQILLEMKIKIPEELLWKCKKPC